MYPISLSNLCIYLVLRIPSFQEYNLNQSNWNFFGNLTQISYKTLLWYMKWYKMWPNEFACLVFSQQSTATLSSRCANITWGFQSTAVSIITNYSQQPTYYFDEWWLHMNWALNRKISISNGIWLGWSCEGINHVKLILDCSPQEIFSLFSNTYSLVCLN